MKIYTAGCDHGYQPKIKTVYVEKAAMKIGMIDAIADDGQPVVIDNSICDIYKGVPKTILLTNTYAPMETQSEAQKEREKNRDLQFKELDASSIPEATKKLIAAEYMRLRTKHKDWKAHRLMRKAGEKYNVKFEFE